MSKKKKKLPSFQQKKSKFPSKAFEVEDKTDYFSKPPVFSFLNVDSNRWKLSEWKGKELSDLINCFQKMEQLTWHEIMKHDGLKVKPLKDVPKPSYISEDVTMFEIRVCQLKRIHGFIDKNIFNLVWFDRGHSVCQEGKNRKYKF